MRQQTIDMLEISDNTDKFVNQLYKYAPIIFSQVDKIGVNISCYKYIERFGYDDIKGYISWASSNGCKDEIGTTLLHDLNAIHDEFILPRTSGYSKYNK